MYSPASDDEITTVVNYVDQQLSAIRAAAYGLTEDQARATPCRSALSVSGIIKHTCYGMRGTTSTLGSDVDLQGPDEGAFARYLASFTLTDEETTVGVLAEFDDARRDYLAAIARTDPDAPTLAPAAPWHGIAEPRPIRARYALMHQVEEMARHAGHADIIREQLDGMSVPALVMTIEGVPANPYFEPYVPQPGTIVS